MSFVPTDTVQRDSATAPGKITVINLLTSKELTDKCKMFAKVIVPPKCALGLHKHEGNAETYHILSGEAIYNDNGNISHVTAGTTTYCADGESHAIENASAEEDLVFIALIINS